MESGCIKVPKALRPKLSDKTLTDIILVRKKFSSDKTDEISSHRKGGGGFFRAFELAKMYSLIFI